MKLIIVPIVAMLCIAGLEAYALYLNINGALLSVVFIALAGLGGYEAKVIRDKIKKVK